MASKTKMPTIREFKTQKKSDPESDSPSSIPSQTTGFSAPSSDLKSPTLPSSSSGYPSFSKLLEGVMAANSAVSPHPLPKNLGFQGPYRMSHQEALASVTAKAAQAHAQMQLQAESAKSSIEQPPITPSDSSVPTSSTVKQEQIPSLQHKDCIKKSIEKNSSCHTSDPAVSSTQKFPDVKSEPVTPRSVASMSSPKKKVDKQTVKKEHPSNRSNEHANDTAKTPNSDGYSWRKYGQKQMKGSGSSRSYYRCAHFCCLAKKKVQHLDISGRVIEVVYKGDHNHDPPQSPKGLIQKRDAPSAVTGVPNNTSDTSVQKLDDQHIPTCGKEVQQAVVPSTHDNQDKSPNTSVGASQRDAMELLTTTLDPTLRHKNEAEIVPAKADCCRDSKTDESARTDPMKERDLVPLKKRRTKETGEGYPETVYRTFKEPKVVVHAAGDAGTSCDGYRWRKYGQKMVKGSPHPRSYYRCSSAGCPVRKHVERATDNSASIIVTYEGKHNHDLPVPKKSHGSPNSPVPVTASVTPNKPLPEKSVTESLSPSQEPPAQLSKDENNDVTGEKGTDVGADKVLESARTLLSIGIELKSC